METPTLKEIKNRVNEVLRVCKNDAVSRLGIFARGDIISDYLYYNHEQKVYVIETLDGKVIVDELDALIDIFIKRNTNTALKVINKRMNVCEAEISSLEDRLSDENEELYMYKSWTNEIIKNHNDFEEDK